jgi:FMN phosphatase YigB (HAD superfamily)/pyrimidine operon attenuation protein/uracil phosphoribosyltransferase
MSRTTLEAEQSVLGTHMPEAPQDMMDLYPATEAIIDADWVLFDFDDTIVRHDPHAQYWVALHTLAVEHGGPDQFALDQFAHNHAIATAEHKSDVEDAQLVDYVRTVRRLSEISVGNPRAFEDVAQAFVDHAHNGDLLKDAIRTLPQYRSIGLFWEARAKMLRTCNVPASFGKELIPGMEDLFVQLGAMGKKLGIISNSRADLLIPALDELIPSNKAIFTEVLTLGGSETPIKPASDSYDLLQARYNINPSRCVYIGNAYEDIAFASNASLSAVIVGAHFDSPWQATFIDRVPRLINLLRRHADGADIFRIAAKGIVEPLNSPAELVRDMRPEEMRGMVVRGLRNFWERHVAQTRDIYESDLWSKEFVSLKNISNFADLFGGLSGDLRVDKISSHSDLAEYFDESRMKQVDDKITLRGPRYYTCIDSRLEPRERMTTMIDELRTAISVVETVDRAAIGPEDLPGYLGVLDNAKQQALSIFHAFTYEERQKGIESNVEYLRMRAQIFDVAARTTRSFYEACTGRAFTTPCSREAIDEIEATLGDDFTVLQPAGLKLQELDHPMKIMQSAYNMSKIDSHDTIIGFPSGGSQLAIATALATEMVHDKQAMSVDVICLPISHHSGTKKERTAQLDDESLDASTALFREKIKNKRVMIVDDNSSTGITIIRGERSVGRFDPLSVASGVAELDPRRILIRADQAALGEIIAGVANMEHKLFYAASGVVPIGMHDVQLRKEFANQILDLQTRRG